MTTAPTNTVPSSRQINNLLDTGRKIPASALAERVLLSTEGFLLEELPGTNATAINLQHKVIPGSPTIVLAFVTATGAPATRTLLRNPNEYTVEPNVAGVGQIVPVGDQSANTLLVAYQADQPDALQGGQSALEVTDLGTQQPGA